MAKQMTLGEFIAALEQVPATNFIYFDFGGLYPTGFHSWRGSYDEIALGYSDRNTAVRAGDVLSAAQRALGNTYEGWKGGDYTMTADTYLWADNRGESSCTAIVGLTTDGVFTYIDTRRIEWGVREAAYYGRGDGTSADQIRAERWHACSRAHAG